MNNAIRIGTGIVTVTAVALWRHWHEPFHFVVGGTAVAFGMLLAFLWRKLRQEEGGEIAVAEEEMTEGALRPAVFGLLGGALICLLFGLVFGLAQRVGPVVSLFESQQRTKFEAQLGSVVEAGNHERAIELIANRLRQRLSASWRTNLLGQLYSEMIEAARAATDFPRRTNLLHGAGDLARTNRLDGRLAAELLAKAQETQSKRGRFARLKDARQWAELVPGLLTEIESKQRELPYDRWLYQAYVEWAKDSKDAQIKKEKLGLAIDVAKTFGFEDSTARAELRNVQKDEEIGGLVQSAEERIRADAQARIGQLNAEIAKAKEQKEAAETKAKRDREQARLERKQAELQAKSEGLLAVADTFSDPDPLRTLEHRRDMYLKVYEFAKTNGLDLQPVSNRLDRVNRDLTELLARRQRETQPVDLPPGVRLRVLAANTDRFPPSIDLEVLLENAEGQPIRGLRPKDFQITCAGEVLTNFALAAVERRPPPLYVVVAIDCSGSMDKAMRAAIEGAQAMIRNLATEDRVYVRVLAFSDKVERLCDWTTDLRQAEAAIDGLSAGGSTALNAAVESALNGLRSCKGDRRLLLFTDGKNTVASTRRNLSALTAELCTNEIQTFTIGLRTGDLDEKPLQRLAAATGGSYFMAAAPSEIAAQFLAARQQLRRAIYRFDLAPDVDPQANTFTVRIKVGGANAVVQSITVNINGQKP